MLTLVTYDISEDKSRTKLAKHLQNYGLHRIQYSGFTGELNPHDRILLSKEVKQYTTSETDSIYVIPLCERCYRLCKIISDRELSLKDASEIKIV
ncbi:MAG: CRISPR-associated endonuclease Cas2 [Methanocellales archaeon]|nr:CRISPR-associated endonuclease Cas2 [Methanocellales archaeon]